MKKVFIVFVALIMMFMVSMATATTDLGPAVPNNTSPLLPYLVPDLNAVATTIIVATDAPPPALIIKNESATANHTTNLYDEISTSANATMDGGLATNCPAAAWNNEDESYNMTTSPGVSATICQRLKMPDATMYDSDNATLTSNNDHRAPNSTARLDGGMTLGIAANRLNLPRFTSCELGHLALRT